jgi:hypothetical protein
MKPAHLLAFGAAFSMALAPIGSSRAQTSEPDAASSSNYLVLRDGKVAAGPLGAAATGDRVVTRGSKGMRLAFQDCAIDVPPGSMLTVQADPCRSDVKSLQIHRAAFPLSNANNLGWLAALILILIVAALILVPLYYLGRAAHLWGRATSA